MEQNEDGREGFKKEQQRQDRHMEKAVVRSVDEDLALRRAEEEHKRTLVDIDSEDGPRGSVAEREAKGQNQFEQLIKTWTIRLMS